MIHYPSQKTIEYLRNEYPEGTRIQLIHMSNDPKPVPDNTLGTVKFIDDMGTIHMNWDNGRSLGLIPERDDFTKL